jgi:hypothetical protein
MTEAADGNQLRHTIHHLPVHFGGLLPRKQALFTPSHLLGKRQVQGDMKTASLERGLSKA